MSLHCPLCKQPVEQESTIGAMREQLEELRGTVSDMSLEIENLTNWVNQQLGRTRDDQH